MAHISHRLRGPPRWRAGALAGGGDSASSPLYVFGRFLKLIVASSAGAICFGAPLWMVVATMVVVSLMYRSVMAWVTDGSGGSGLCEEELGGWAVKVNASITVVEYTRTFLVSIAALVTFAGDRFPLFSGRVPRAAPAIGLSVITAALLNRGPKTAATFFDPATLAVLVLLWGLIIATVAQRGIHLPDLQLAAFHPSNLGTTLGAYVRLLESLRPDGVPDVVTEGSGPERSLIHLAESGGADLVVIGTHGQGSLERATAADLGSVTSLLLRKLACPLLVVPSAPLVL